MRRTFAVVFMAALLLTGCSDEPAPASPAAAAPTAASFDGPSGRELESEQEARNALEAQRVAAERLVIEAAAQAAAQAAAAEAAAAEEAAAREAAKDAAAQAVIDAEGGCPPGFYYDDYTGCTSLSDDDGYVTTDLEVRCSDGTATIEECFGPGSDLNGNGVADVNE